MPIVVFLAGLLLVVFASRTLWVHWREDVTARNEYEDLRSDFESAARPPSPELPSAEAPPHRIDMSGFSALNSDFVGWISIPGTAVSYPIVQGADNDHYLDTTFRGEPNPAGAIFMDYRMGQAFDTPITMLHGHNMRDGSMFASLHSFLDPAFLRDYSLITVVTAEGETLVYEVFAARRMSAWDPIYSLDFNDAVTLELFAEAPAGTGRVLLLSTCASGGDHNARVVVYAALQGGGS